MFRPAGYASGPGLSCPILVGRIEMTEPLSDLSTRPTWLPSVTGLRWWAALFVLGQHVALAASESCPPEGGPVGCTVLSQGFMHGFVGVACFFVISGFVLVWSVNPADRA